MRGFWKSRSPWSVKKFILIIKVLSPLLSGMKAFVLMAGAHTQLHATFTKFCRRAAGKAATYMTDRGVFRSISNEDVAKYWKFIPLAAELRYRKLKWVQSMVQYLEDNIQVRAALFGQMTCEAAPTVLPNGKLFEDSNPWAKHIYNDMQDLQRFEAGSQLLDYMDHRLLTFGRASTYEKTF
jgi:hypothetical protein